MAVLVTKAGRVKHHGVIHGGRYQALPGRLPLGEPSFRFLLDGLKLGRQPDIIGGIGRERSAGSAQGRRSH